MARAARDPALSARPPFRALVLGWHGSRERHLRIVAKHYESRGAETIVHVPRTFRAMSFPDGWQREAHALARTIIERDGERDLPLVIHAFSNAGFWSATALLDALQRRSPGVRARFAGSVLDSAPGFPERVSFTFTAKYASRAMLPGVLEALGLRPAATHPLLTPPFSAFLGLWHLIARRQVRFMESSQARMRRAHHDRPLLLIWGGKDELVLPVHVERFADRARDEGVRLERLYFDDGTHVRHFVAHRSAYFDALDRFIAGALSPGSSAPV